MSAGDSLCVPVCTGFAIHCSLGETTSAVLSALHAGQAALSPAPFELPFAANCGVLPNPLQSTGDDTGYDSRQARLGMQLTLQLGGVIRSAIERWGAGRVGLVIGTSTGGVLETEQALSLRKSAGTITSDYDLYRTHSLGAVADLIAQQFGIAGPRWVVSTACSSGAKALASARRLLRASMVDAVVTGGIDTLCQLTLRGFHALGLLSPDHCRPFAETRSGIAIGEGGALMVLEREGTGAVSLLGVGESSDAYHMSSPDPEGRGAEAAMAMALRQADVPPSAIAMINAHGTGTRLNDAAEAAAIGRLFGADVPVLSTKGYMGHLLGASGAVEAALCVAALEQGWSPASYGCAPVDPKLPIRVQTERSTLNGCFALSNSLAFGGSNASVLWGRSE